MPPYELILLALAGLGTGILAGFLGIGGGTVLVPLLVAFGFSPLHAVATSNLSITITAISGSIQNWRMGLLSVGRVVGLGLPAIATAQVGAAIADWIPAYYLLTGFGFLLLLNIYLVNLRQRLAQTQQSDTVDTTGASTQPMNIILFRLFTGAIAGLLAGLFGVGGGVIMVPLQILLLKEPIKVAIQTSLGVVVITAISACVGHALRGNVLWTAGIMLGLGGLVGAQISTRFLPKLPDRLISLGFRAFLGVLSIYVFAQAWQAYQAAQGT
ncbi:MAG TPA: sulfite exporter TauE/SafE family protein [Stenomitos sp.]